MNIHEYQAKDVLRRFGVPVPGGAAILEPDKAGEAAESLAGDVFAVKAQIHAGGRGKGRFVEESAGTGGGVRLAHSAGQAAQLARQMLGATLITAQTGPSGRQVNRVYIEEGTQIAGESYLSLLVDRSSARIAFVVSTEGGMDIEEVAASQPEKIVSFSIDPVTGFQAHHGRRLAGALGLRGALAREAASLGSALYRAFTSQDMEMLEINPLVTTKDGHLVALDAKLGFDGNGLYRHKDIAALRDSDEEDPREVEAARHDLSYIALDGTIGCMVNGAGLAMATMDIIKHYGAEPANFLDVGGGASAQKVTAAFKIITSDRNVKGILINIFGGIMRCDTIAEGVLDAVRQVGLCVPLVVRLEGTNVAKGKKIIAESGLNVISADDLDDAARKIVAEVGGTS